MLMQQLHTSEDYITTVISPWQLWSQCDIIQQTMISHPKLWYHVLQGSRCWLGASVIERSRPILIFLCQIELSLSGTAASAGWPGPAGLMIQRFYIDRICCQRPIWATKCNMPVQPGPAARDPLSALKSDCNAAHLGDCKQLYGLSEGWFVQTH